MGEAVNGICLSTCKPEFESQLAAARCIMKKGRAVLHELAKGLPVAGSRRP